MNFHAAAGVIDSSFFPGKKSFFGIGFGPEGVPIDIMPICFSQHFVNDFSLLVVDEFQKMNGVQQESVAKSRSCLLDSVGKICSAYNLEISTMLCSDFMGSEDYNALFRAVKEKAKPFLSEIRATVPESKRGLESAIEYPLHEIACVKHLESKGFSQKIGPSSEKKYDSIMESMGFGVSFAYVVDAFALGTKSADSVVHYVPSCRGPNNGQRIFIGEPERKAAKKLEQGCDESLRYFCRAASAAAMILGREHPSDFEISILSGRHLKKMAQSLVFENLIIPMREAGK